MYEQPSVPYPGPNPNYGQPAPYYPPEQPILYNGDSKDPYEGGRFKPKKTINDPVFLVLFILQVKLRCASCFCSPLLTFFKKQKKKLLGFAALSGIVLSTWISQGGLGGGLGKGNTGTGVTLNRFEVVDFLYVFLTSHTRRSTVYLLLLITAAAILLSVVYLLLTRMFTKIIMHITLVLTILLNM